MSCHVNVVWKRKHEENGSSSMICFSWLHIKLWWAAKNSGQSSISIYLLRSLVVEVYTCLHNIAPEYLCTLRKQHNVSYELRDTNQLAQKTFNTVTYGKR